MLTAMKFDGGRVLPLTEEDVKKGQLFMDIFSPIEDLFMRLNGDRECIINRVLPTLMEISGMETEFFFGGKVDLLADLLPRMANKVSICGQQLHLQFTVPHVM